MDEAGALDLEALAGLIDWHVQAGTAALVIAGTTGESPTLTASEHRELLTQAVAAADGRIPVIAGSGSNGTAHSIELTEGAVAAGVDAVMTVVPYYNKPSQEGLLHHFRSIAAAVPDTPVLLYNVPGRTVADLLPETVIQLAQVDNIVGIKEATGDLERARRIRGACGEGFLLLSGDDPTACRCLLEGGDGVISVTANLFPEAMARLCAAARSGEAELAQRLDRALAPVHDALFVEPSPAPTKWALERMGRIGPGIRSPMLRLSDAGRAVLAPILDRATEELLEA